MSMYSRQKLYLCKRLPLETLFLNGNAWHFQLDVSFVSGRNYVSVRGDVIFVPPVIGLFFQQGLRKTPHVQSYGWTYW